MSTIIHVHVSFLLRYKPNDLDQMAAETKFSKGESHSIHPLFIIGEQRLSNTCRVFTFSMHCFLEHDVQEFFFTSFVEKGFSHIP